VFHTDLESGPGEAQDLDTPIAPAGSLRLVDAVHAHIRLVLRHTQGNKRRAARELGVGRATLERKLREMNEMNETDGDRVDRSDRIVRHDTGRHATELVPTRIGSRRGGRA
jgi:hypothetical protein